MTEFLLSKLTPPRIGDDILNRPRLLQRLDGVCKRKATLFFAPAGYGKTIAMYQLAVESGCPVVWFQLDAYDNDPAVFIQYFITGLQQVSPGFGRGILPLIEQGNIKDRMRLVNISILNELSGLNGCVVLAFDDIHLISERLVLHWFQDFLDLLPQQTHVMMAGRVQPNLTLCRLKAANQVVIADVDELRFSAEEIRSLLVEKAYPNSGEVFEFLVRYANGWPAAVRMILISSLTTSTAADLKANASDLYEYLAIEVLEKQPIAIREFLKQTSVLDVLSSDFCNRLLERDDSQLILDSLTRQGLFLIRLGESPDVYRYHPLFREFLQERLGSEKNALQRKAGMIARDDGDAIAAVEYLSLAGANDELISLLRTAGQKALGQGRWQTVERWLCLISLREIEADPWLALFTAQIKAYQGLKNEAADWVRRALDLFSQVQDSLGQMKAGILQSRILRGRGYFQQALDLLTSVEEDLEGALRSTADIIMEKAINLGMLGRFKESEEILKKALEEAERENDGYVVAILLEGLGNVLYFQGDYAKALQVYRRGIETSPDRNLPDYYLQNFIAAIYLEWGEIETAYEYARNSVSVKEKLGLVEALPSAYSQLADIFLSGNEYKKAEQYYRRAIGMLEEHGGEHFDLMLNLAFLARCLQLQGSLIEAYAIIEGAINKAAGPGGIALAVCQEMAAPIYMQMGRTAEAGRYLFETTRVFEEIGYIRPLIYSYAALCQYFASNGNEKASCEYAHKILAMAARKNIVQCFLTYYPSFERILQCGIEEGIETSFVQRILVRLGTRALPLLEKLKIHSRPEVRSRIILPLAEIGGDKAFAIIGKLTMDSSDEVRNLAYITARRLNLSIRVERKERESANFLSVKLLGACGVFDDRRQPLITNWRTAKTRDLFFYLIHQPEPVGIERILEDLWPELSSEKAGGIFHTTLYYLRQMFSRAYPDDIVFYQGKRYVLHREIVRSDRQEFEEWAAQGLKDRLTSEKAEILKDALALYEGDYLSELDYAWVLPTQEYLKRLRQEIHQKLARFFLERKECTPALNHLRVLNGMDPYSEEYYRLEMSAYAGMGNRVAIKELFDRMVRTLNDELGLAPEPETVEIYQRLIR